MSQTTHGKLLPRLGGLLALALISKTASALSLPPLASGQDISLQGASYARTIQSAGNNPASVTSSGKRAFWFGLGSVSAAYEYGPVDDLTDRIEAVISDLLLQDLSLIDAREIQSIAEDLLNEAGKEGYLRVTAQAQPPLMPLGFRLPGIPGDLTLGAVATMGSRIGVLDAPVEIVPTLGGFQITSDATALARAAVGAALSLGYSRELKVTDETALVGGVRLTYHQIELAKGVVTLEESEPGDAWLDDLEDEYDRNARRSSGISMDAGLIWRTPNYQLGATLLNLNAPSFKYAALGQNCDDPARPLFSRNNCHAARRFADRVKLRESYRMDPQVQLEASLFSQKNGATLNATWDVNSIQDALGDDQQWLSVSGTLRGWWILPGLRAGYHHSLAGAAPSQLTAGLSFLRVINLDAAMATETVTYDGKTVPRSAMASVSFEVFF